MIINDLIENGYIDEKGKPLKCIYCDHTDFKMVDDHYCPMGLEEYSLQCENCSKLVGTWAYGHWQI